MILERSELSGRFLYICTLKLRKECNLLEMSVG